jgi:hypothetical protein
MLFKSALVTGLDMPAKYCCSAAFYMPHHLGLLCRQEIFLSISLPVLTEDIGDLWLSFIHRQSPPFPQINQAGF